MPIFARSERYQHFSKQVLIALGLVIATGGSLYATYLIKDILLLFFVAFILAAAVRPMVLKMKKKFGVPEIAAVLTLQVALISVIVAFFALILPPLIAQSQELFSSISLNVQIPNMASLPSVWNSLLSQDFEELTQTVQNAEALIGRFGQSVASLVALVNSLFTGMILTVTLFVVMYYLIVSYDQVARSFAWMLPGTKAEKLRRANRILENVSTELGAWIRGRLLVMVVIGAITYLGLRLLGIPYALPLAIVALLLEIIPNIGPTLSALPAMVIGFLTGGWVLLALVTLLYVVMQQVENSFITPQVMKQTVDVHPLTTIFLILNGLILLGVEGALLILPLYVTIRSVWKELAPNTGPLGDLE